MEFRGVQSHQNTVGFNVDTGTSPTVELCAKCKKGNGENVCRKCQKALSAEKRIDMGGPVVRRINTIILEETKISKRAMVDLDGTIHKYSQGWKDGSLYDGVFDGAREAIQELKDKGYEIVIFTARLYDEDTGHKSAKEVGDYLKKHDIYFDQITHEKLPAAFYIDDKAIQIKNGNWDDVMKQVKQFEKTNEDITERIGKLLIETIVVGGSYISGTTINVIGSQQTRAVGDYTQAIEIMQQKEPDNKNAVRFNKILGAFVPREQQQDVDLEDGEHEYIGQ